MTTPSRRRSREPKPIGSNSVTTTTTYIGECSCPYGEDGNFCKHCVAVGLVWLNQADAPTENSAPTSASSIRAHLEKLDKAQLVAMLMEQVKKDTNLQERLMLQIAQSKPSAPDLDAFYKAIDRAIVIRDYLDYDETHSYNRGVKTILKSLKDLLAGGFAAETRTLTQHAMKELNSAIECMEDEEGTTVNLLGDFHQLHLQATLQAPPSPSELVEWLFEYEMISEWDTAVEWEEYLPALGNNGTALFQQKIADEWEKLPALAPGDSRSYDDRRARITRMMTEITAQTGTVHDLIELKKRDLSSSGHFLDVAKLYLEAGEPDNALEWAEQGRVLFGENTDRFLLDFLVEQYTARQRYGEAYAILWKRFQFMPDLGRYQELQKYAEARGEWESWRVRAWELLRQKLEERNSQPQQRGWLSGRAVDHSELVQILLWEKRNAEAWEEAQAGGCSQELWLKLAETREVSHPEDALRLYREQVMKLVEPTTNGDYSQPMKYLHRIRDIMERTGQSSQLGDYVRLLRSTYKLKRNFIKLLNENGFPA